MFQQARLLTVSCFLGGIALLQQGCSDDGTKPFRNADGGLDGGPSAGGASVGAGGRSTGGSTSSGGKSAGGAIGAGGTVGTGGAGTGGAGTGGTGTGGAGTGGAGTGGTGTGGAYGSGGSGTNGGADAGTADDGGTPVVTDGSVGPDATSKSDGGIVVPPAGGLLLVAGTDYFSGTEVVGIDLTTLITTADTVLPDGDAVVVQSAGKGFIVERTNDRISTLNANGEQDLVISLRADGGTQSLNPHDVVVVKGQNGAPDRAFVSLYNANRIDVLNLSSGTVEKSIDLSGLLDPSDADGSVDVDVGIYVESLGRVYFAVQRIDTHPTSATGYQVTCPPVPSLLVTLDATTGELLDESDGGIASIPLNLVTPSGLHYDATANRLLVTSTGCVDVTGGGTLPRAHQGIESVPLAGGSPSVLYSPGAPDFITGLLPLDATRGVLQRYDSSFDFHSSFWTFGAAALGTELLGVPDAAAVESSNTLLGIAFSDGGDAGKQAAVVRYNIATGQSQVLATNPWYVYSSFAAGSVVIR